MKKVSLYTDGACSGNPGPGGWGAILEYGDSRRELSGGERETTNNRMELMAVIKGLEALNEPCEVAVTSDSKYVVDGIEKGWAAGWRARGWKKSDGKPALNPDLWERLLNLVEKHKVTFHWIRGHSGHPENERADDLAVAAYQQYLEETPKTEAPDNAENLEKLFVYADNAATTKVSEPVLEAMLPYFTEQYGNPSSIYELGRNAKRGVETARQQVAKALGAENTEIYFTSGGTESDNWAIKGIAKQMKQAGKTHIITSVFEHHAVLHSVQALEKEGFTATYLPVDSQGLVSVEDVKNAITEKTALVTIMYANNEIGTIQPIQEIGAVCQEHDVIFHTDAVQAIGNVEIDVERDNIDLLSLSGHKIHAPKGVGALYVRKGIRLPVYMEGGAQERRARAGTENVPSIVGLGKAIQLATTNIEARAKLVRGKRNRLIEELLTLPRTRLNGHPDKRLAGNVNISFEGIEGESILLLLDMEGIAASSGSACTSGSLDPSHVLLAIGLAHEVAHGSLRLSISDDTTEEEIDRIIEVVPKVVERLRAMSPLWDRMIAEE